MSARVRDQHESWMKARRGRSHRNLICGTYNCAPMTFAGIAHISMATSAPLTYFQAVVLGLLQGVTELFPISSLGHTVLFPTLFGWDDLVKAQSDPESFWLAFVVMLHVGSAIGLLIYFWRDWVEIVRAFFRTLARRRIETPTEKLAWLIIATTIPTGILGLVLEHPVRVALAKPTAAAVFLMINGLILLGAERLRRRGRCGHWPRGRARAAPPAVADMSYREGVGIGFAQSTALIAGISRDGVCMGAGLFRGLTTRTPPASRSSSRPRSSSPPASSSSPTSSVRSATGSAGRRWSRPRVHRDRGDRLGALPAALLPDPQSHPVRDLLRRLRHGDGRIHDRHVARPGPRGTASGRGPLQRRVIDHPPGAAAPRACGVGAAARRAPGKPRLRGVEHLAAGAPGEQQRRGRDVKPTIYVGFTSPPVWASHSRTPPARSPRTGGPGGRGTAGPRAWSPAEVRR